jgi:1,2-phenylacetyl-CoA epoxidase PaaB subunit
MIKRIAQAALLIAILPGLSWAPIFSPFSSLSNLIAESDCIAIITVTETRDAELAKSFTVDATRVIILHTLKGDIKPGPASIVISRLPFLTDRDFTGRWWSPRRFCWHIRARLTDALDHRNPRDVGGYSIDLFPNYAQQDDRRVIFLRNNKRAYASAHFPANIRKSSPPKHEYGTPRTSGNQFWVAPSSDMSALKSRDVRQNIDTLLYDAIAYDKSRHWRSRDYRFVDDVQIYLGSE